MYFLSLPLKHALSCWTIFKNTYNSITKTIVSIKLPNRKVLKTIFRSREQILKFEKYIYIFILIIPIIAFYIVICHRSMQVWKFLNRLMCAAWNVIDALN